MLKFYVILSLSISTALYGCATTYNPATEQQEFIFVTTPIEVTLGNMLSAKVSKQFKISNDAKKIKRLTEIGKKVTSVSDRQDLTYHLAVIEDDSLNAFTTPGGYIYVNSGVLEKSNDGELACVIGHEVGHVAARHIAKKLQAQLGYDILMNIATRKSGLGDIQRAASLSYDLIMLGYSREDELLADRLGVKYAYKAGYDPHAMITFLKKLDETKDDELGPVFLRSHPYASQRIKILEQGIPSIIDRVDKKTVRDATRFQKPVQKQKNISPAETVADKKRPLKVMCPVCKKIFSGSLNYCPYDGTKL